MVYGEINKTAFISNLHVNLNNEKWLSSHGVRSCHVFLEISSTCSVLKLDTNQISIQYIIKGVQFWYEICT
jgi:hypothetical protein